jgi:hypothetical protein
MIQNISDYHKNFVKIVVDYVKKEENFVLLNVELYLNLKRE